LFFMRSRRRILLRFGSLSPKGQEPLLSFRLHSGSFGFRAITHRGNRQAPGGRRHSPCLFSREDRRRLF
jgi:hypothetical protein